MRCQDLLDRLKSENQELIKQVEEQLRPLDIEQWAWRSKPTAWNTLEILEHLNRMFDRAFTKVDLAIDKAIEEGHNPTETYQVGWIGEVAVQLIDTNEERKNTIKLKTPPSFNPIDQPLESDKVLETFLAQLREFDRMLERARL
ncbi:MAG: DinB family protein, partial [Bacteroidota bacterium]